MEVQVENPTGPSKPANNPSEDASNRSKRKAPIKQCLPDGCCGYCSPSGQFLTV